jgi:hypothetical protein
MGFLPLCGLCVLGVDLLAVRVHLLLLEPGKVEEMARLELILPHLSGAGLIRQQSFFTLGDAFIFMVFNLQVERRQDFGIALGPARYRGDG